MNIFNNKHDTIKQLYKISIYHKYYEYMHINNLYN